MVTQHVHVCSECEIEFHVKHEGDTRSFPVLYCPFCSQSVDVDETFEIDDEDIEE
jgi:hypothetical protein